MTGLSEFGGFTGPIIRGRSKESGRQAVRQKPSNAQAREGLAILRRIRSKDRTAIKDCIDTYGSFVWSLARKFAGSTAEAETLSEQIFRDIWQVSEGDCREHATERQVIATIALRRVIKQLGRGGQIADSAA